MRYGGRDGSRLSHRRFVAIRCRAPRRHALIGIPASSARACTSASRSPGNGSKRRNRSVLDLPDGGKKVTRALLGSLEAKGGEAHDDLNPPTDRMPRRGG